MGLFSKKAAPTQLPPTNAGIRMLNTMLYNYIGNHAIYNPDNPDGYINTGYLYNADIYSIIKRISKTAAACPFVLHEIKDDASAAKYMAMSRTKGQDMVKLESIRRKAFIPVTDHPIMQILKNPNPDQSAYEFFENYYGFKLLLGNGYIYGAGPDSGINKGKFQELYILPAHLMQIVSGGIMEPVQGYKMIYRANTVELPAASVLHGKYWSPDYSGPASHLYGLSPLRAASIMLQRGNDAVMASAKMFQNMGPAGILAVDDEKINFTPEQQDNMDEKFINKYTGPNKAGGVIMTNVPIKWEQIGMSPVDLGIIESEKMTLRTLCNVYGVSSSLFNDSEKTTFNNVDSAKKELICNAVLPELVSLRDDLNRWLVSTYGNPKLYLDFDLSVYPEMAEDQGKLAAMLGASWWVSPNEKRMAMGFDPMPDPLMDECLIPNNIMQIDDLNQIPEIDANELAGDKPAVA